MLLIHNLIIIFTHIFKHVSSYHPLRKGLQSHQLIPHELACQDTVYILTFVNPMNWLSNELAFKKFYIFSYQGKACTIYSHHLH